MNALQILTSKRNELQDQLHALKSSVAGLDLAISLIRDDQPVSIAPSLEPAPVKPRRAAAKRLSQTNGRGLTLRQAVEAITARWTGVWTSQQVRDQLAQRHPGMSPSNLSTVIGRMIKDGQISIGADGKSYRTQKPGSSTQDTLNAIKSEIASKEVSNEP